MILGSFDMRDAACQGEEWTVELNECVLASEEAVGAMFAEAAFIIWFALYELEYTIAWRLVRVALALSAQIRQAADMQPPPSYRLTRARKEEWVE